MAKMILLVGAALASGMLLYLFLRWERSGREHWVVFLLFGLLVFESTLWDNETTVPKGLFHPGTGSLEFRLPEVIISVAIVARLLTKGRPQRIGLPALLWVTVAAWWSLEAVEGVLRHNSLVKLPYEAKAIIYVMGAYALASGVPIRRYLEGRGFQRLVRWSALSASLLLVLTAAHKTFALHVPLLRLSNFGSARHRRGHALRLHRGHRLPGGAQQGPPQPAQPVVHGAAGDGHLLRLPASRPAHAGGGRDRGGAGGAGIHGPPAAPHPVRRGRPRRPRRGRCRARRCRSSPPSRRRSR